MFCIQKAQQPKRQLQQKLRTVSSTAARVTSPFLGSFRQQVTPSSPDGIAGFATLHDTWQYILAQQREQAHLRVVSAAAGSLLLPHSAAVATHSCIHNTLSAHGSGTLQHLSMDQVRCSIEFMASHNASSSWRRSQGHEGVPLYPGEYPSR